MLSHVFPGQGAQRKGMLGLAADFPDLMAQADGILGYSLEELCQRDPERRLNRTCYTQPALFVANALAELKHRDGLPGGAGPDFVLGHSLGEYNALFAAGVLDFATALRLVQKRGALMDKASGGAMAVVIGLTAERIEDLVQAHGLALDLANLNAPDQVALSGLKAEIDRARPLFQDEAQRWVPLKVSAAFHSRHMADAATAFATFLEDVAFAPPQVPVISNVTARPHDMERFGALLAQQIRAPVRWTESIQWLCDQGVDRFEELGPGTTLTGLIDRIRAARPALVPVA
ncbi:MAG: ACP S-malonyltransferase, partial [Rhodospirillaceae bacterium]